MNRGWKGVAAFLGLWIVLTGAIFPLVWAIVTIPPVFGTIESWAPGSIKPARVFGRLVLAVALAGVPLLLRFWKDGPRRFFLGESGIRMALQGMGWGAAGLGMVAVTAEVQKFLGVREWAGIPGMEAWAGALATGLLVAGLEEFFFRGVLGLAFWRAAGQGPAALLLGTNAAVFSLAHFLKPRGEMGQGLGSGFLGWSQVELWTGPADPWKLAGLWVGGLILARLTWQRGNLWAAIGLHAGWVAGLRMAEAAWPISSRVSAGWWGPSLEAGPIPLVMLLLLAFALWGRPIRAHLD